MTFQFAWAGPAETSFGPEHEREDEEVFAFWLEHTEGDFPTLLIEIRNPRRQYLAEDADLWMWLSEDGQPLFLGRWWRCRRICTPRSCGSTLSRARPAMTPPGAGSPRR